MTDESGPDTPLVLGADEIVNYPLRRSTRGYNVGEVDDLLDQLAQQTASLTAQLQGLWDERDELRRELEDVRETETTLKKTLVTAQRAAEASIAEAREEAEQLRQAAAEKVESMLAAAAEQAHELRETALRRARAEEADARRYRRDVEEHIERLRTFAADHQARLRNHLEQQQARLDGMVVPEAPPAPTRAQDAIVADELDHSVPGSPLDDPPPLPADADAPTLDELRAELAAPDDEPDDEPREDPGDGTGTGSDEPATLAAPTAGGDRFDSESALFDR